MASLKATMRGKLTGFLCCLKPCISEDSAVASLVPTLSNNHTAKGKKRQKSKKRKEPQSQHAEWEGNNSEPVQQPDRTAVVENVYHQPSYSDFTPLKVIGQGAFGKVVLTIKKNGVDKDSLYAVKIVKKAQLAKKTFSLKCAKNERQILASVDHPFVVQLKYCFQTADKVYMVMHFMPGGDLYRFLGTRSRKLEIHNARFYAAELVLALEYLHSESIIYRDLKLENTLIDWDGHIKVVDFGFAKHLLPGCQTRSICGTVSYTAPEIAKKSPYDHVVDWWSFGVTLYNLVTFNSLYAGDAPYVRLQMCTYPVQIPTWLPADCKQLLSALLVQDPLQRLGHGVNGASDVKSAAFFKHTSWDDVLNKRLHPPFIPAVTPTHLVGYLDKTFINRPPHNSVAEEDPSFPQHVKDYFEDFEYVHPSLGLLSDTVSEGETERQG